MTLKFKQDPLPEQFRMNKLQVFNWGTFSGIHQINIAERGFLFVGRSGSGKSTLLDAFSALIVPPRWVDFNAAAREADRTGRDRDLISYVRGAWAEQKDDESGEIATRYLRHGTTWSALALTYTNKKQQAISLVQIFWLRGNTNSNAEIKRYYLIFERRFDLAELEDFSHTNFDVRNLKKKFGGVFARDEFRPYCEHFCRLFNIESEMALRLLHKTQSAKNLGDLNLFLRDFMLDKAETFTVADRLVKEFDELNAAHQTVVTARQQIEVLTVAYEQYQQLQAVQLQSNEFNELLQGITSYCEQRQLELLQQQLLELETKADGAAGEVSQHQSLANQYEATLRDLAQQHHELGGDRIEQWETEQKALEVQHDERLRKRGQAQQACQNLTWILPDTPQGFAQIISLARQMLASHQQHCHAVREEHHQLAATKYETENKFSQIRKEIAALRRQPSNIPFSMLELRQEIATAINISETTLPFIGELIQVKSVEAQWQGVIERVLHGFALSLLVEERYYAALTTYINSRNLGRRLVYYRTSVVNDKQTKPVAVNSLIFKLDFKAGNYSDWLQAELRQRFDYACVDSLQAFRSAERAVTITGQLKHNKTRHEKDDRNQIDDRSHWVLGFNNQEKLQFFERQAQQLAVVLTESERAINALATKETSWQNSVLHCQTLLSLQWQEIDSTPLLTRIDSLRKLITEARTNNTNLQQLHATIILQKNKLTQVKQTLINAEVNFKEICNQFETTQKKLTVLQQLAISHLTPYQTAGLTQRFTQRVKLITLDNLEKVAREIGQDLNDELKIIARQCVDVTQAIENQFAYFIRTWPIEATDLCAKLSFTSDFFAKLSQLELDGLPAYEQRFFELLQNQSHQNLAALASHLTNARAEILERMVMVNASLSKVPFNQTAEHITYLQIEVTDRQLIEVREFKQAMQQALSYAWNDSKELAEARFIALRCLVARLASQDAKEKQWRETVLDVRQHVEFVGNEIDNNCQNGRSIETHRSSAGKSGGQRQKLATTCLAAALRYQLGGNEENIPCYAAVVMDEAFDKADNEFTALAMNIFANFGFQMIIATPLKSVMTLEPFIGGACFVDISERRTSGLLLIEYDNEQQRLRLPHHNLTVAEAVEA